ncbi:MAG: glycerol kinase [Planctomycetota bacterium]|jgi:glycerol kinase|nr:MAG: glycerol kinase [Planctomycetota bacterium]
MTGKPILSLDQGTTSSRAIVFGQDGRALSMAQRELPQIYPAPGDVEHDPEEIWQTQLACAREALARAGLSASQIGSLGITNQRETTILWDKTTGTPVANAIVWQSRVSAPVCDRLKAQGHEALIRQRTGLVVDAYFSGTKVVHLLETIPGLRGRAERGEILFGTVDTWLIWKLTGGRLHLTDVSNASRTLLFDIHRLDWDDEILGILNIPRSMLPRVVDSSGVAGHTDAEMLGTPVAIAGIAGDQQAATFGQACFQPGSAKNTYGTGCFLLMNTGDKPVPSSNNLLTTVGWRIGGKTTYCLEGAVFVAGAVVQWLRDGLGIITKSEEVETLAASVPDSGGVFVVPAFTGLGAPYWDPKARGGIFGLTRGSTAAHIARAAVESMAWQSADLLGAMQADSGVNLATLKADGGASRNNALLQFQSDLLGVSVRRPRVQETTALGVAYLAGLATGTWNSLADIERNWVLDREFTPTTNSDQREKLLASWRKAVGRTLNWVG